MQQAQNSAGERLGSDIRSDLDAIRGDLNRLRNDVATAFQDLIGQGKDRVWQARERVSSSLGGLSDQGRRALGTVQEQIEDRPMVAIGTAIGLGFVIGMLLCGGRNNK
ncbi:MAG TPA: hypothetical protein VD963_10975 [Phycisphaerales bacterium]|nr:hypothetical protein [Phycisphaerales bacterium]